MKLDTWLASLAAAGTLAIFAMPAQAAPVGSQDALKRAAAQGSDVEQAHWYGRRHGYRYYYGPRYRHRHYGYRPGFRFYYGPRYHRHHWRHRHHRHW
jgi:hypothetical protein